MSVAIIGGVYRERCGWPGWNQLFGSGGRAAAAISGLGSTIELHSCASAAVAKEFADVAELYGFSFHPQVSLQQIAFDYVHPMSIPQISPSPARIEKLPAINVEGEAVVRFGMMESNGIVRAGRCVYDPQSAFGPESFHANGSTADELAIVANRAEALAMGGGTDPVDAARSVLWSEPASVFVLKLGAQGSRVLTADTDDLVPAFRSDGAFTIGSGDVFAATFAFCWAVRRMEPVAAARVASTAVAEYVASRSLPIRPIEVLSAQVLPELIVKAGEVYLASPFFTMSQRWLVDEARRCLAEVGLKVFSPFHEIGPGPAEIVAPADIEALRRCDLVFAVVDGLDSGTIFEMGYANAIGKPVYGLSQNVSEEDLKMLQGSGCRLYDDFTTAVHHAAARQ